MATPQGYTTASVVQNANSLLYGTFDMGRGQFFPHSTPFQENFRLQHQVPVQYPIHPSQTPSPYICNGITSGVFISDTNQQLQRQQQCGATTNKQSESSVLFQHDPSRAAPSSISSKYYQRAFPTSLVSRQYQTIDEEINMVVEHQSNNVSASNDEVRQINDLPPSNIHRPTANRQLPSPRFRRRNSLSMDQHPYPRNTDNNGQNIDLISQQALRFAETRYKFPPFVVTFQDKVQENEVIKELKKRIVDNLRLDFALDGYRLKDNRQLFLFVKDRDSFIILFDEKIGRLIYVRRVMRNRCPVGLHLSFR
ncbi:unnamed protein product [Didymodactylos carnosus]|uniref:Uncharacterized protein n=1 Tax=Didymodactylos carnosus TaxID=1234261 RepID=A0A814JAS4_9BILA|nr:unnamed protein product [Didymodactylos carnosus]CAF3806326.1 unnamed protein product [Didymodactylos carnosus]